MFIAWLKQKGEGCDYTIGCGFELVELQSQSLDAARLELENIILGEDGNGSYTQESGRELSEAHLYEVNSKHIMPLDIWYQEHNKKQQQAALKYMEEQEHKEFERLQKKFGK